MICPNCHKDIPNEAKFCLHCGTKIEVDNTTIECPSCHARIPKDSKFCPDCGKKIEVITKKNVSAAYADENYMPYISDGKFGYMDRNTHEIVVMPQFDTICNLDLFRRFYEGYAIVYHHDKSDRMGVIDRKGNTVFTTNYYLSNFHNGLARIINDGAPGYMNTHGDVVLSGYEETRDFHDGVAWVKKNGLWGAIDTNGREIVRFQHIFCPGNFYKNVYIHHGNIIDKNGKYLFSCPKGYYLHENFNDGLVKIGTQGSIHQYGFIDVYGREVIPCDLLEAENFSYGLAKVKDKKYNWKFINTKGQMVISSCYNDVRSFHNGYASVYRDGKYGLIDTKGNTIVPFIYDVPLYFDNGVSFAVMNGKIGLIDINNREVVPFFLDDHFFTVLSFEDGVAKVNGYYFDTFGNYFKK